MIYGGMLFYLLVEGSFDVEIDEIVNKFRQEIRMLNEGGSKMRKPITHPTMIYPRSLTIDKNFNHSFFSFVALCVVLKVKRLYFSQ